MARTNPEGFARALVVGGLVSLAIRVLPVGVPASPSPAVASEKPVVCLWNATTACQCNRFPLAFTLRYHLRVLLIGLNQELTPLTRQAFVTFSKLRHLGWLRAQGGRIPTLEGACYLCIASL